MHDPFAVPSQHSTKQSSPFEDDFTSFNQFKASSKFSRGVESFKSMGKNTSEFENFDFDNGK